MTEPTVPAEYRPYDVSDQTRVKRLRGYRIDETERPEVVIVTPGQLAVQAPLADNVQTPLLKGPSILVSSFLDEMELKVKMRTFSYQMEDDGWDPTDVWYGRGAINQLDPGSAQGELIGTRIFVRRLVYRGFILNSDSETIESLYRLIVVRDSQRAQVTMDANVILMDGTEVYSNYHPSFVGLDKRFQVLADQTFNAQKAVTTHRIPFCFVIDLPEETVTFIDSDQGWWPNYYLVSTYNDDSIHLVLPRLEYTVFVYYVDA